VQDGVFQLADHGQREPLVAQGLDENWHGHVTALTVAPEFRRIGLGATAHACFKLKFAPSPAGAPCTYSLA
jgi:hypothetical protein